MFNFCCALIIYWKEEEREEVKEEDGEGRGEESSGITLLGILLSKIHSNFIALL